jgi:polyisoprenoid-binding protein YceI
MRFRRQSYLLLALSCALPGVVLAALSASEAKVSFTCSGPGGIHLEGTGSELEVEEKGDAVVLRVPLQKVTTGIGLRDTHMHEKYLETQKYPNAELSVPRAALKFPEDGASLEATAQGTMTIHGTSKPVTFHYKASRKGKSYEVKGDVDINMNDYGIGVPSYLGVTVKPLVAITAAFRLLDT